MTPPTATLEHVEANGLRFACLTWGEGPLVLLFHGFPDSAHTWNVIGPRLAQAGFRAVAPFMRGYAPTQVPPRDTTALDLAQDVVGLIEALGAGRAPIIGHDWGADAVYAAAGFAPERIAKVIAVGLPHRHTVTVTPSLLWTLRHFFTLRLPGAVARFPRENYAIVGELFQRWSPTWKYTDDDVQPVREALACRENINAALGYYRAVTVRTPAFMRAHVKPPTMCVLGSDDPGADQAMGEHARRHFAGPYEVAMIPGGHFCHREAPDAFVERALRFLR